MTAGGVCCLLLGSARRGALCCLLFSRCWVGDPTSRTARKLGKLQVLEWICTAGKDTENSRACPMKLGINIKREHLHLALGQEETVTSPDPNGAVQQFEGNCCSVGGQGQTSGQSITRFRATAVSQQARETANSGAQSQQFPNSGIRMQPDLCEICH